MAYQKRNFQKEQLLTAYDLNIMDAQIAKNEESANDAKNAAASAQETANNANKTATESKNAIDNSILQKAEILDASDDLNQIRGNGFYSYYASGIPKNAPFGANTTAVLVCVMSSEYTGVASPTLQIAVGSNTMKYRANHTLTVDGWKQWKDVDAAEILQTFGTREDAVMSQKAVTEYVQKHVGEGSDKTNAAYENSVEAIRIATAATQTANDANKAAESALRGKTILSGSDNIDNVTEQGIYTWLNGDAPSGIPLESETGDPTPRSGMLLVYNHGNQYYQIAIEQITARTATRAKMSYDGAWSDWAFSLEVKQTTGTSDYYVMSQSAVSKQIERIDERINNIVTPDEGDSGADYSNVIQTLSKCFTNGVFASEDPDALKPVPGTGLKLVSNPGTVLIEGYSKTFAKNTRGFAQQDTDRVEVYLLRLYTDTGKIENLVREVAVYGDVIISNEDGAQLPIRGGGLYDILIHKVTIPANATQITADMIVDYRSNDNYCGHVRSRL